MKKTVFMAVFLFLAVFARDVRADLSSDIIQIKDISWKTPEEFQAIKKPLPLPPVLFTSVWERQATGFAATDDKPMIAIVIDDMGVDRKHSRKVIDVLPEDVTLAYLPYASRVKEQAARAREKGHELVVHLPMQPERKTADPGPDALLTDLDVVALYERINKNLSAFEGYAGVNNHMGSRFTQDEAGMNIVMRVLKKHGLYFLDSRTIPGSLGEKLARQHGVATTHRDVFLDDQETQEFTLGALQKLEAVAQRNGSAIAIGHPKDITIDALVEWIPTLKEKGFQLVPLSTVIKHRQSKDKKTDRISLLPPCPGTLGFVIGGSCQGR